MDTQQTRNEEWTRNGVDGHAAEEGHHAMNGHATDGHAATVQTQTAHVVLARAAASTCNY